MGGELVGGEGELDHLGEFTSGWVGRGRQGRDHAFSRMGTDERPGRIGTGNGHCNRNGKGNGNRGSFDCVTRKGRERLRSG